MIPRLIVAVSDPYNFHSPELATPAGHRSPNEWILFKTQHVNRAGWKRARYCSVCGSHQHGWAGCHSFVILDRGTGVCGYEWFVESHRTSFYIKSTYKPMQTVKVSIHGPDRDHVGREHFRFDFTDPKSAKKAVTAGGGWGAFGKELPLAFTGRQVNKRTVHLARFSAEWSMFRRGMQRGPDPKALAKASLNAVVDAPKIGRVTHVDLYLSRVWPYWGNEKKLRRRDAGMGPLVNEAGQILTAVIGQLDAAEQPDPFGDPSANVDPKDCIRGVAQGVDSTGLLWVSEKMIPKAKLAMAPPPPRGPLQL